MTPTSSWELKHDGFRALAYVESGSCRLISRKQIQYKSFAGLSQALAGLRVKDAILDGEIVCLDNEGRSQFNTLMRRRSRDVLYYAFDLMWLDGQDLRPLPLLDRKAALRQILRLGKVSAILGADHVEGIGTAFFKAVCARDCEGVVGKHKVGPYGTPNSWFKVINPDYSQHIGRREMFEKFHERQQGVR